MTTLTDVLDSIGFDLRPQQDRLYRELLHVDEGGTVAQAGTGTGKSLAVLCAAVDWARQTGEMSLVVTPTNVLMDQYLTIDAPRVAAVTGARIESLKGRNRYLCESANGFSDISQPPLWVLDELPAMSAALHGDAIFEPQNTAWFGCPGGDECDRDLVCHYRLQKANAQQAEVVVTNSHLLIIDSQLKRMQELQAPEVDEEGVVGEAPPLIFPRLGVVLVDEAHVLESSLREFASRSIGTGPIQGYPLGYWIDDRAAKLREPQIITPDTELVTALAEMRDQKLPEQPNKRLREATEAAGYMLQRGTAGAYASGSAVLYIEPAERGTNKENKLISTQIDMSLAAAGLLTAQPFGMVSATIPQTLRAALGVPQANFVDVGHPFDYAKQVKLGISAHSGAWKVVQADRSNEEARAEEIAQQITASGGGALVLFPSYRDLESVYRMIAGPMHLAGIKVLKQERDSNRALLGAQFKTDGNAVLFGTESFATGFDVPGDALRLVVIWKLPYAGLDPVTRAISNRDYRRYKDMMLTKVAQAAGRLIRTTEDRGEIWIADQRARGMVLGTGDPMLAHFDQMQTVPVIEQVSSQELY